MRSAGILLGIASLPSNYGIGDFGTQAYQFVDILATMKVKIWQVLPLNPLGYGNSPYQPYSSFAGDELYISLDKLADSGLLIKTELTKFNHNTPQIDYDAVRKHKQQFLAKAFANFSQRDDLQVAYQKFISDNNWVYNYAVFMSLKKHNNLQQWSDWPIEQKNWIKDKQFDLTKLQPMIDYELFIQFIFYKQWLSIKQYANAKQIEIMGDIPIYLGYDSLDVWENKDLFLLDENDEPSFVAGVPPDYFSKTGQRWGNPIYDWAKLEATEFEFWLKRLELNAKLYDIIRIDHFRAFDTFWQIPATCPTAIEGEWVEAPGYKLFAAIYKNLPQIKIVVEDLGDLRTQVLELRDYYKLAGMQVFQFVFNPQGNNDTLMNKVNTIIYTGTHDNETLMGWYYNLRTWQRKQLKRFFGANDVTIKNKIIRALLSYQAKYVIIPVQDLVGYGNTARINFPGKIGSPNWEWKLIDFNNLSSMIEWFSNQVVLHKR